MSKMSKIQANYHPSSSKSRRCGTCSMYTPGKCSLVQGPIKPEDVCRYYKKAKGESNGR